MRWSELTADLSAYLRAHDLKKVTLMGHSLGGKIAMKFACDYPALVKKLIIVDIAAKVYPPYHDNEFRAMKRVPAGAHRESPRSGRAVEAADSGLGDAPVYHDESGAR